MHRLICRGYTDVVDADLSGYFDSIPHADLMRSVARRVIDRHVLHLIKLWLKAPVEERDSDGKRRMSGGRKATRGTPQGGVASPLLANIYMNRFPKHWRQTARSEAFQAHVVSYADDFVILSRGKAHEALAWTRGRTHPRLPHPAAQGSRAWLQSVPRPTHLRGTRRAAPQSQTTIPHRRGPAVNPVGEPDAGNPPARLCVQRRLACSAGDRPAGATVRSPVVWIAGWRETKTLKPIDKVFLGEITSRRAVTKVNVHVASKVSGSEGRGRNRRAKAAWGAEI